MRNFLLLMKWFLFRRWHLQMLCWDYSLEGKRTLYRNMKNSNMGGCCHPVISCDLKKILEVEDKV